MRSPAASSAVVPTVLLTGVLLAGCGPQAGPPPTSASPGSTVTPTTTPAPTAEGTPSATATAPPSAAWTSFTTADGELTFDHPAAWSIKDPAGELPEGGGTFAEVTNQAGKPLATLRTNMATGSTCMERSPYSVMESEELPALTQNGTAPRYIFETRGNDATPGPADTPAAAYGIQTSQLPTGASACPIFHFFTWPPTAAMFGAFYSPDNNVTPGAESLPYLEQAKKYAETDEYQDIRRMITSLRPPG
jgi:hypothetical protein